VITMEQWQTIRHLATLGKSQRWIAKALGICRKTVARAIAQESMEDYSRPLTVRDVLESHRLMVEQQLSLGVCGLEILKGIKQHGYPGSDATFYRWLASVRTEFAQRGSSVRFETGPAVQSQFDWSPYTLRIGGREVEVRMFALAMGYSRRVHWHPSLSERQDSVHEALESCILHFGGACRTVLVDNARSMVLLHRHKTVRWNPCFLALCGHYRVQPIAATPVHPQTKGKVENPFRTLERRLLYHGNWHSWDHLIECLSNFETSWEQRVHPSTGVSPAARFEEERSKLIPIPSTLFLGCKSQMRLVQNDGLFSWGGVRYCVPCEAHLRHVRVRTYQGRELLVYNAAGNEVMRHTLCPSGTPPVLSPKCYEAHENRKRANLTALTNLFRERYVDVAPSTERYLQLLLKCHQNNPEKAIARVLELLTNVPTGVVASVFDDLVTYNLPGSDALHSLLAQRMKGTATTTRLAPAMGLPLPVLDVERPLSAYSSALADSE